MEYQLTLRLANNNKGYSWLFESPEDTIPLFDDVIERFRHYEADDMETFILEKKKEIEETGSSQAVQIDVTKVEPRVVIRSASYKEMWYEGKYFDDILEILNDKLGPPENDQFET
ncbi:hypothetical protein [Planococcus sp. ISL-110]|uniref:hypothetical protein n=1 Tax=Planococcus sp. ISL-110 TaxID=2819167 RepID=UPI001BECE5B4|nr:hypothetical protein [Planococcus sp. ISL-110]MBT2569750.1 hypothetical protein [Planococcus sp. ISL-110]